MTSSTKRKKKNVFWQKKFERKKVGESKQTKQVQKRACEMDSSNLNNGIDSEIK
jgi:hypothetical protein